uniref:Uncharacterized protein n=1 Tax=Arundo donax TaxID=35708 RepID=A0A0A9DCA5_ARUDO
MKIVMQMLERAHLVMYMHGHIHKCHGLINSSDFSYVKKCFGFLSNAITNCEICKLLSFTFLQLLFAAFFSSSLWNANK